MSRRALAASTAAGRRDRRGGTARTFSANLRSLIRVIAAYLVVAVEDDRLELGATDVEVEVEVEVTALVELEAVEVVEGTEALVVEDVVLACDDELVPVPVPVVTDAIVDGAYVVEVIELEDEDVDDVDALMDCTETVEVDELLGFRHQLFSMLSRNSGRPAYVEIELKLVLVLAMELGLELVVLLVPVLEDGADVEDEPDAVDVADVAEDELDEVDVTEAVEGIEEDEVVLVDDAELSHVSPQ